MAGLDLEKLTSVEADGTKIHIIPAEVRGYFRKHRNWSQGVLLVIFLALPWTRVNGHQTIFLDLPNREFALLGILFKSHDAPLLFFIVAIFLLGLALVTSLWGRVWCGWACPQTVFIDGVYRRLETWIEGNYIQRRKLRDEPLNFQGFVKKSTKWLAFFLVSSLIAHSFIAYFVGAENLLRMMGQRPEENGTYFLLVTGFTAGILFNFGWFREQFCVIMCPYGRTQGLLLDQNSLAVVYDVQRGEPRKEPKAIGKPFGDCVSCNRCVQVCPTGIDIRNGLQMECINCTACIDACDEIMEKVHKPKGLIRYETLNAKPLKLLRPRAIFYTLGLVILSGGLVYSIATRTPFQTTILRGLGLPYTVMKDEGHPDMIVNHFKIHIQNQSEHSASYLLSLECLSESCGFELTVAQNPLLLNPGQSEEWHFFVKASATDFTKNDQVKMRVKIQDQLSPESPLQLKEIILIGPKL